MKAKLYINGIYWTTYTVPELVPHLYVALHFFHHTSIWLSKQVFTKEEFPIMTFTYKYREKEDNICYSLLRVDS